MRSAILFSAMLLSSAALYGDFSMALVSVTPISSGAWQGDYDWTYSLTLGPNDEAIKAGPFIDGGCGSPCQSWPDFFNLIDFNSPTIFPISTPSDWGGDADMDTRGLQPFYVSAPNQAAFSDVQIDYTGATPLVGPQTVCCFSFVSSSDVPVLGWYEAQLNIYQTNGRIFPGEGYAGQVDVPWYPGSNLAQVPEPATGMLVATGLAVIGLLRRRGKRLTRCDSSALPS